jgi:hypothetical protein
MEKKIATVRSHQSTDRPAITPVSGPLRPISPGLFRFMLNELRLRRTEQHADGVIHAGRFGFTGTLGEEWLLLRHARKFWPPNRG